jgi:hypothetical protein
MVKVYAKKSRKNPQMNLSKFDYGITFKGGLDGLF